LYHTGLAGSLLLPPFLDIKVAAKEIAWFTGNPFLLGCMLASSFTLRTRTGPLAIANAMIGNEEPAAELAVLGQ